MIRGLNLTLAALCVVSLGVGSVFAFTPSVGPIPDVIIGDLTPQDTFTPGDPFTHGDSLEGLAGQPEDVFDYPNALNIFDLVEDTPSGVPGFTSDESLTYQFLATPVAPATTNAAGEERISINGERVSTTALENLSALVAASPEVTFKDEAFSVDSDATAIASIGNLTYNFQNTATGPTGLDITRTLIDENIITLQVTNQQGISGSDEFFVYTVNDGPDAVSGGFLEPPVTYDLSSWTYDGNGSAQSALGPSFPGDTSVAGSQVPSGDASVVNLNISMGGVGGDSFIWWQSPLGDLEFTDGATYRLTWTVTSTMSGTANPLVRMRWGYGPFGNMGGGSVRGDSLVIPPTASGQNYHMMFDQLDVASANSTMDLSALGVTYPIPENGITLYFEAIDLDQAGPSAGAGGGAVELENLELQQITNRAALLAQGALETEVTDFTNAAQAAVVGFNYSSSPGVVVTPATSSVTLDANVATAAGTISVYGNFLALSDQGIGMIPFAPSATSGSFFRFSSDVDASANSTTSGVTIPKVNLQFATFDIAQYFTVETDVQPLRAAVFGAPGGLNPAMNDANESYAAYMVLPAGTSIGTLSTGSQLGALIAGNIRLQDDGAAFGGTLVVNSMVIDVFPESILDLP
ncbi:hypothetical protein JXA47_07485 [Candidatus Sumerlaeota bacterium]|nr:hypothetical protein [Candidatus Sumerlaeota bacterium]